MLQLLLALPFVAALGVMLYRSASRRTTAWLAGLAPLAGLGILASLTPRVLSGEVPQATHPWIPQIGLAFSLRMDGLAWMFALMVLAIGALVVMYARYYLGRREDAPRFFGYLLLFMGSMLGMVLAGNLLLLAVFWELTSITSFLLIGYWSHKNEAREGARMALTITGAGGLALLGGVILIGQVVGSFELDAVLAAGDAIRASTLYPAILGLVLLGIFTKSAQFPFHFWLPHAMAAPTPVSAYLHSATMVKAGVFLLARLYPVLSGTDLFFYVVSAVGAATLLIGAWNAIFQHDLKGLLAYSTISHLGLITLLFGLSTPFAVVAGLFHILNHATFKASLFMAAGIIDHETGTRDMRRLGNLRRYLPYTSALAVIAALAMAGIPLLNGFLSKEMFFAQALELETGGATMRIAVAIVAFLAGAFGVAYSLRFVHDTFFGDGPRAVEREIHEPPRFMRIPVGILAILCLMVGIVPAWTVAPVLATAARGVLGDAVPAYSLAIWHGFNHPLMLSIGGMIAGGLLYLGLRRLMDLHAVARHAMGRHLFRVNTRALLLGARRLTFRITQGSLQRSLWWVLVAVLALAGPATWQALAEGVGPSQPMPPTGWVLWAILMAATVATVVLHRQRLVALLVVGAVGLAVSLVFVLFSAPDLALTQLLVEMVTIALMLLALNYLPQASERSNHPARRWRDVAIALVVGIGIGGLAYAMMTRPLDTIASELLARSLPEGYGRNVVNVILVDFRGFDTFGEITVFGIAGLVVHALLRRARIAPDRVMPGAPGALPMPSNLSHLLFPLALAVSAYMFLRGHNAPGGGFIAGLVLAVPLLLQYVLLGSQYVESRLGFNYVACIGAGLLVAAFSGLASMLLGYPFLTSGHVEPHLPLLGPMPLASAMAFDTGVYLVVFGGAMLILSMMGTIRPPKAPATPPRNPQEAR
ncbi:monovalent cation/H+ antiporter subunit A [Marilutibacter aestuarii]|uniref:Monovalent cation/H+ antiporter subunit A n=1 Tax=Marilutibacter aestuarii TaxID=1706195 RepID=A0A507ZP53_9GAMM|nr:monovalent cation/H+ antiporter subunit A [Lysobacter aestuarii]TQD39526.1 monovalent cation/H+ antiporter subunit A [Lysobacter aestuarii]